MDESRPTLAELRPAARRSYVFLRRALNQGVGVILLSIVLLSLTAIFGRISWTKYQRYNSEVAEQIRGMMAPNEPRRDDPRPGLLAAVLAPINGEPDKLAQIPALVAAREAAAEIHADFGRWIEELRDRREGIAPAPTEGGSRAAALRVAINAARPMTGKGLPEEDGKELDRLFEDVLTNLCKLTTEDFQGISTEDLGLKPVFMENSRVSTREQTLGPAWTDAHHEFQHSALVVPSITADGGMRPYIPDGDGKVPYPELSARCAEAILLSRLFELSLRNSFPLQSEKGEPYDSEHDERYTLLQSYYISPDSVLRLFTGRRGQVESFPPSRLWASANYFETLLHSVDSEYLSPAYIDFAGRGVVVTYTTPVLGEQVELMTGGKSRRFLGVVGTDIGIPDDDVLAALVRYQWLFDVERIDFQIQENLTMGDIRLKTPPPVDLSSRPAFGAEYDAAPWDAASEERRRVIAASINAVLAGAGLTADDIERRVTTLDDARSFLVPLGSEKRGWFHGVILTPKAPDTPWEWLAFTVICGAAFFALTLQGALLTRRAARLSDQASILRGLQVGVVLVDEHDKILGANDSAEELLGAVLPKYGASTFLGEQMVAPTFVELIEPRIAEVDKNGELRGVAYAATVPELRRRGKASEYFVRTLRSRKILKISASPMLSALKRRRLIGSFGVLEEVRVGPALEKIQKNLARGKSGSGARNRGEDRS